MIESRTVYTSSGEASREPGRSHTYRIPALAVTKQGALLAFAEARHGSAGDCGDIGIVVRRSDDGGRTWGPERTVLDQGLDTTGNPCPVVLDSGRILLLACWNSGRIEETGIAPGFGADSRRVFELYSDDDGETWSEAREITRDVKRADWCWYATGPGAGIQLTRGPHTGRVIIPCDHKAGEGYHSHIVYSDDDGETWAIGAVSPNGLNECEAVELSNGDVMLNCRNHGQPRLVHRGVCISRDGGKTFDEALFRRAETLVEPRCQASIRRLSWPEGPPSSETSASAKATAGQAGVASGAPGLIVFANPAVDCDRCRMTVRGSYDDGETWAWSRLVYEGSAAYSDLAALPDGRIGLLYEKDESGKIEFAAFPPPGKRESETVE